MERPSHISFQTQHLSRRLPFFVLAGLFQVGAAALIMTGLGHRMPTAFTEFRFVPEPDKIIPKPPPPPEPTITRKLVIDTPPLQPWTTERPTPGGVTVTPPQPPGGDTSTQPRPLVVPDHGAVAVMATHTQPPYPPIAIRQNLEGKVLLRLTVLETGKVARAEVVTSSGSDTLDQAAQGWIVAHWAYRPALAGGQPVASQAMASVDFNLKNAR